ncbi:MAG: sugar phosphate isomerase/epimerase family protein [Clostridiaceae bacterium]
MTKDKIGIFSWFGYIMPIEERLRMIKDCGFTGVAIWWEDEEGLTISKKEQIPELVEKLGLHIENIHAPFCSSNDLWSSDESIRREVVNKHIQWIKDCSKFNIPLMVMHISEGFEIKEPNNMGVKSLGEIVEAAEEYGVKVAIENTDDNALIHYILSNLASPSIGLCFDTSHNEIASNRGINLLKLYGNRLFATHISDNDGLKDRHWTPFDGNINWNKIKEDFPKGYNGYLSMEICAGDEDKKSSPEEYMKKAYDRIIKLRDLLF